MPLVVESSTFLRDCFQRSFAGVAGRVRGRLFGDDKAREAGFCGRRWRGRLAGVGGRSGFFGLPGDLLFVFVDGHDDGTFVTDLNVDKVAEDGGGTGAAPGRRSGGSFSENVYHPAFPAVDQVAADELARAAEGVNVEIIDGGRGAGSGIGVQRYADSPSSVQRIWPSSASMQGRGCLFCRWW